MGGCRQISRQARSSDLLEGGFRPVAVRLQPSFTHIEKGDSDSGQAGDVEAYVTLKDLYGDSLKYLGRFRFELFKYRQRVSDPRGERFEQEGVQEFDLTEIEINQQYWDSTTGNYRFDLKLPGDWQEVQKIVLQITFSAKSKLRLEDVLVVGQR